MILPLLSEFSKKVSEFAKAADWNLFLIGIFGKKSYIYKNQVIITMSESKQISVKCNNGTFIGKETDELIIWKGIPYATQPVGKLRWKKALPAADDDGVYDATKPGPVPIGPVNDSMGTAEFGEDCEFRHVVKEMWTNFARTGNPSTEKYAWKKFSGEDRQTMVFDDAIGMQKDIFGRREDLMMSWAERLGNGSSKRVC